MRTGAPQAGRRFAPRAARPARPGPKAGAFATESKMLDRSAFDRGLDVYWQIVNLA